ncbi:MAG: DUF881 domain-containing protein [Bacillota bacterium]
MRASYLTLLVVGLFFGLLIALQIRLSQEIRETVPIQRVQKLTAEVQAARAERDELQQRVAALRAELDAATAETGLAPLRSKLERYRIETGLVPVSGPGVEVTLKDSGAALQPGQNPNLYVLHDEDVLRVLNELRAAGAEVLALNGERILSTTEIRCIGPAILINKTVRKTAPFVITAIGDPQTLNNSLEMPGGVVDTLQRFWGIQVSIREMAQVTIPAYKGSREFEYARPVKEAK